MSEERIEFEFIHAIIEIIIIIIVVVVVVLLINISYHYSIE
jgi:hypothetical protein